MRKERERSMKLNPLMMERLAGEEESGAIEAPARSLIIHPDDVHSSAEETPHEEESYSIQDANIELIHKALERHGGNRKAAAAELGISERTLYRKLKQFDK